MEHFHFSWFLRSCFFIVSFFQLSFGGYAQYYSAQIYKDEPGMTSNRIYDLTQHLNGEMWFATQEGLCVYDGLEWKIFPDSMRFLPHHGNVRIIASADSGLYVLGVDHHDFTLKKYKHNIWTAIPLPEDFSGFTVPKKFQIIETISSDKKSELIISWRNSIYQYDGAQWAKTRLKHPTGDVRIHQIKNDGDSIWIATDKGLMLYHDQKIHTVLDGPHIYDLHLDKGTETMYLLGADWVAKFSEGTFEKIVEDREIGLISVNPLSYLDQKGDKLYYSLNSPLYSYDLKTHKSQPVLSDTFNKDYTCMQALIDQEGNLWVATLRGAFKISNLNVYSYNRNQLVENEVSAILESSDGDIYLGNNSGFNILKPDGEILAYEFSRSFLQHRVMDIIEYEDIIYFAANSAGVVSFINGELHYALLEGESTRAYDLHIYKGRLFAATNSSIYEKTPAGWKYMMSSASSRKDGQTIRKILWDENYKYLLTPSGVFDCDNKKYYISENPQEANVYVGIVSKGKLYLGTSAGITEIQNERIIPATSIQNLLKRPVYSFLIDKEQRLWSGTEHGIVLHDRPDNFIHVSKANGLIGNEVNRNAFIQMRDGRIFVGTDEGLSIYTPTDKLEYPVPKLELVKITANDSLIEEKELAHDENQIRFHFRGISFYDEKLVNYRVRLDGFENDWQQLPYHNQRSILYTNINPGSYRFLVQARVSDGEWSQTVHSDVITIKPAYYDTIWFRLLVIAGVIGIVILVLKLRSRHLKFQNDTLEIKINEKTKALNEQNLQLVKTINDLKSTQGQLIQSEKLASMGHLTAGIAHEMNNPLNYIRGGAECLKQNLKEITELYTKLDEFKNADKTEYKREYEYLITESNQLIDSILNGAEKSTHIVKSLSSFTADAQNFYSFVDLEREVETALTLLNNHIGFRITINKFFGNIPRLECYPARINQMLVNILLNAVQAIKNDEGEITIRIYRKDINNVALEVADNGEGIDAENEEKVFEPFFTTKDNNPGLGLTIVKSIVQDHHGEVHFTSHKKRGTKILVILPIQQTFHPELEVPTEN